LVGLAQPGFAQTARDARVAKAAEQRDVSSIRALLKQGVDVNVPQADGATALQWAVYWDDAETVDLLLRAGAKVSATNDHGVTPLALACENGSGAMVARLLKAGASANAAVGTGETALMTAARAGSVEAVKALVAAGANVNAKEPSHSQTALMWAVANHHPAVVRALVESGADVRARSDVRPRAVHTGNRYGDRGADRGVVTMDLGGFTPLLFAAREGDLESGKILLTAGASANEEAANGASALVVAAHSGQGAFAALLLERGADPNAAKAGYTALHAAVLRGDLDTVKALLARGANPNAALAKGTPARYYSTDWAFNITALEGATPFWLAARYGDIDIMKALAAGKADVHVALNGTNTLLAGIAANSGFGTGDRRERYLGPGALAPTPEEQEALTAKVVKLVLELGVPVKSTNPAGDTAVHLAAQQGLASVIQLLVDAGADIEAANKRGQTPLAVAIAPRPPNPIQIDGPDRRAPAAALLRKLGAKEPPPPAPVQAMPAGAQSPNLRGSDRQPQ
jgi:ankyrin repeat protein